MTSNLNSGALGSEYPLTWWNTVGRLCNSILYTPPLPNHRSHDDCRGHTACHLYYYSPRALFLLARSISNNNDKYHYVSMSTWTNSVVQLIKTHIIFVYYMHIFHSYEDVTTSGESLQRLKYGLWSWIDQFEMHLMWRRTSAFVVLFKEKSISLLLRQALI
jgi:hypothetical protein